MTASLFYEQKYDWSTQKISEAYEIHRPKEVRRAKRFINDVIKLPNYKQDELYEFLFYTACKVQEKMRKEKELAEWLEKLYRRWMRYNGLERDLVEQMIGV